LYRVVDQHLDDFGEQAAEQYAKALPRYVVQEFRRYRKCGQFEHGFIRCRCDGCGYEFLVPFSCGNRGVCPSCTARRMTNTAAFLTDRVLPNVPIRQWVLSLPFELRLLVASKPEVLTAMGRIFVQELFRHLRRATGQPNGLAGAVSFTHRAGGSLNLNPHFHAPTLDGVFVQRCITPDSPLDFVPAPTPTNAQILAVTERVHRRAVRWLRRHGYVQDGDPADESNEPEQLSLIERLSQFAMQGGGYERLDEQGQSEPMPEFSVEPKRHSPLTAEVEGFNVNASVHVAADDDVGRERLIRYCGRPSFALSRLSILNDGRIAYRIRYARRGSTHRVMTPVDLLARLAALIPPPRHPLTRYYGVLSSHSKYRSLIVPRQPSPLFSCKAHSLNPPPTKPTVSTDDGKSTTAENGPSLAGNDPRGVTADVESEGTQSKPSAACRTAANPTSGPTEYPSSTAELQLLPEFNVISARHLDRLLGGELLANGPRLDWAKLMRRSFAIDPFRCPSCGSRMRPIAEITDRDVIDRILEHLATRESRAPPSEDAAPGASPATLH